MELDERAKFYFKHKAQIEEWCNLESHVSGCVHQFFCSLEDGFRELAQHPDLGTEVLVDLSSKRLGLYKKGWTGHHPNMPRAMVAFGWGTNKKLFEGGYSGIWIDKDSELSQSIKDISTAFRQREEYRTEAWWPAWKYEKPSNPDYWNNLDTFKEELLKRMRERWQQLSPIVDQAIASIGEPE